eukprot:2377793-Amphidinium_carterae.1
MLSAPSQAMRSSCTHTHTHTWMRAQAHAHTHMEALCSSPPPSTLKGPTESRVHDPIKHLRDPSSPILARIFTARRSSTVTANQSTQTHIVVFPQFPEFCAIDFCCT